MKAVVDRIVQYANRYQLTNVETGEVLGTFDFEEVTGTVQQVGTEIDKELFDSIANDLAARVKLSGGELAGTIVTFSDISGTAENVASGDTSATLWGKVKNWFSRLKALAFKNKVASGDFEAGAIKNADVATDAAIAQSKVKGLMTDYVASISVSGRTVTYKNKNGVNMGSITTQDTTYGLASQSSNGLMSATDKTKLDGIQSGAQKNTVLGVKGSSESGYRTGNVNITKANIGLGNVDNTSDEDKPVSTATQNALNGKANTSGTYPNLTVGKATNATNATNAETATAVPATLVPNNADLNDYRGENYWGKTFYAGGNNTVQNTPVAGIAFNLEVLCSGAFATTQRITMMAVGSNNQPTMYTRSVVDSTATSADGTWTAWTEVAKANGTYPEMAVGSAEHLSRFAYLFAGDSQTGWWKLGSIKSDGMGTNQNRSCVFLVNGVLSNQGLSTAGETGFLEFDVRKESAITDAKLSVLGGNLNADEFCVVSSQTEATVYIKLPYQYNAFAVTMLSEDAASASKASPLFEFDTQFIGSSAPSGAVYAVVRNNASGDEDGNNIKETYAKKNDVGTVVKTATEWQAQNPVLSAGQFGYDTTNKITKVGDGSTLWNALPFLVTTDLSFAKASWKKIAILAKNGDARNVFSVGDEKTINLTNGTEVTLVILGFNHDDLTSGGKAGITIGTKELLPTSYYNTMNDSNTNIGGWNDSRMRISTMARILSQLPNDLQEAIKLVDKKTTKGGATASIITSSDRLFLLSEVEIDGTEESGYRGEGEQYEYWKKIKNGTLESDRVKHLNNGTGDAAMWWLRSPAISTSAAFRAISQKGSYNNLLADNTIAVSFAFCV